MLVFIIGTCFLGGLVMLAAPIWYIRKIEKEETDLATVSLHSFGYTLFVSGIATIDIVASDSSFAAFIDPKSYELTSSMAYFWLTCILLTLFGVLLSNELLRWRKTAGSWMDIALPSIHCQSRYCFSSVALSKRFNIVRPLSQPSMIALRPNARMLHSTV